MTWASLFAGIRGRLVAWVHSRVVWVGAERRALDASTFSSVPWIVILGREHYEERRKIYGIRSWRGLRAVLKLDSDDSTTLHAIGRFGPEGREVRSFHLLPSGVAACEGAFFVLPESLLLSREVGANEVLRVERDHIEYYLARGVSSQLRGGAIVNEQLFLLSAGLPEDATIRSLSMGELGARLDHALRRLAPGTWWTLLVARERWLQTLPWKTLTTTAAVALLIYLSLASTYLEVGNWWRERQLAALGSDVGAVIERQREIDRASIELRGMSQLANERIATYHLWAVLAELWRAGGTLTGFEISGSEVTLRGGSPSATAVLAALTRLPQVRGAKFDAPVRSDYGQENFTIILTLVTPGTRL